MSRKLTGAMKTTNSKIPLEIVHSVPTLYAQLGNKSKVAEKLGISLSSVTRILESMSDEEWERLQNEQFKYIARSSTEIIILCLTKIKDPEEIKNMSIHQAVGTYKVMGDSIKNWGLISKITDEDMPTIEKMMLEAENVRLKNLIKKAVESESLEPLKA